MKSNLLANKLLAKKNNIDFWAEIKRLNNCKPKVTNTIIGITGNDDIAEMWKEYHCKIFNSVKPQTFRS